MTQYDISNEYNITETINKFSYGYILDVIEDRLNNLKYENTSSLPNVVSSFEENFKIMQETYPADGQNIMLLRSQIYSQIIEMLCTKFDLAFNYDDDNIDLYSAAYYLYDFLIKNRNVNIVNFYTAFIINNKNKLYNNLVNNYDKKKDTNFLYNKNVYTDSKYFLIIAKMEHVLSMISTLDITLTNIFESIYINRELVIFLDNMVGDKNGNFFKKYYYDTIVQPDVLPIVITNIKMSLQKLVGNNTNINLNIEGE